MPIDYLLDEVKCFDGLNNLYKTINVICEQNNITVVQMCNFLQISESEMTELKTDVSKTLSDNTIKKISDYFFVKTDFIYKKLSEYNIPCPLCNFLYVPEVAGEIQIHNRNHRRWQNAVKRFGFCWANAYYRNEVRWYVESEIEDIDKEESVERLVKLYEARFKAYFSRAVMATDIPLNTITFEDYIAGLLSNKNYNIVPPENSEVYKYLVSKYGTKEGYIEGTYFKYNKNNRATTSNNSKTNKVLEKTLDCSANQKELITIYDDLNSDGQSQLMQQARNLSKIDEYKKCSDSEQDIG